MNTPDSTTDDSPLILVVDDSRLLRDALCAVLEQSGYRTASASNGREGFERAVALLPALILSDLEMPEVNGFELFSLVRAHPSLALVPFVLLTAVSDSATEQRARELGVDELLLKPTSSDEIIATVRGRIGK